MSDRFVGINQKESAKVQSEVIGEQMESFYERHCFAKLQKGDLAMKSDEFFHNQLGRCQFCKDEKPAKSDYLYHFAQLYVI